MTDETADKAVIEVDADNWLGELAHNWNYIGYDEINYTYVPEGQELLEKFKRFQEKPYYIRAHHILCTGNCHASYKWGSTNVYMEDQAGKPLYNWKYIDLVFDTILQHGCKPFVEIGFMPQDLVDPAFYEKIPPVTGWNPAYQQYQQFGWSCPPKDYDKWYDLVHHLVRHSVERYGEKEVAAWYWELWNEPDIRYWAGSQEEFFKLYDYTAAAVKSAYPGARVGGPAVTNPDPQQKSGKFLDAFLDHCQNGTNFHSGHKGTSLDFITFHAKGGGYPFNLKAETGAPPSVKKIMESIEAGYAIINKYPGYNRLECILSEIDPDGWAAGGRYDNINLNFRNTEYYPSFVASAFDKVSKFAREKGWDLKLLTWAFLFVGERCFEGTRSFSTQGIDKPILNLFRMYAMMGTREISLECTISGKKITDKQGEEMPDVSGLATITGDQRVEILLYNHHPDWNLDQDREIELEVSNLPFDAAEVRLRHYRIDDTHSNAYAEWIRQGQPMYPAGGQKLAIKAREGLELLGPPAKEILLDKKLKYSFSLPVHGISLLLITPYSGQA